MAYTLQIHGEKRVYPIPNGLYELMGDITREVLRNQPNDVLAYITEYIDAQIETKLLAQIAVTEVEDILAGEDPCISLCASLGVSLETANRAAAIIQAAFLGYITRKKLVEKGLITDASKEVSESGYVMTLDKFLETHKISFIQATLAAIRIQASWRGHVIRRRLRSEKEHATSTDTYAMESWKHDWLWKEFEVVPKGDEAIFKKEILLPKRGLGKTKYLPRRMITIDHHKLKTLFHGEKEDYDELLDKSDSTSTPFSVVSDPIEELTHPTGDKIFLSEVNFLPGDDGSIRVKTSKISIRKSASLDSKGQRDPLMDELEMMSEVTLPDRLQLGGKKSRKTTPEKLAATPQQVETPHEPEEPISVEGEFSLKESQIEVEEAESLITEEEQSLQTGEEEYDEEDYSESAP